MARRTNSVALVTCTALVVLLSILAGNSNALSEFELKLALSEGATPPIVTRLQGNVDKNHRVALVSGRANRFELTCLVQAKPKAKIQWYKDDNLISASNQISGINLGGSDQEILEFSGKVLRYLQ